MLENLIQNDIAIEQASFLSNEVQYNLIHRVMESENSTCLKTSEGHMIFAQSPGHNGWLWVAECVSVDIKENNIRKLIEHLTDLALPGISGAPHTVEYFAKVYSDLANPDSNKIYKNIGFVEAGKIADIRFDIDR
jgi:uncharacterized protein